MDDNITITKVTPLPFVVTKTWEPDIPKAVQPMDEQPYVREPTLAEELASAWLTTKIIAGLTPHIIKLIIGLAMNSWKTTLGAIIAGLAGILNALGIVTIPADVQMGILTTALFVIGLFAADDKTKAQ